MNRRWRWLARLPALLFRARLGWFLDGRFLLLHHTGRRSGRGYATVLEVIAWHELTNSYYVAAGFGERTDWYQNILACPEVELEVGVDRWRAIAERLSPDESEAILTAYARDHRLAFWCLGWVFDFRRIAVRDLARRFPIVRLRTTQSVQPELVLAQATRDPARAALAVGLAHGA